MVNKKSNNVLKRDNGRFCWMGIRNSNVLPNLFCMNGLFQLQGSLSYVI